ncbi:hypothetical protein BV22DRAFT_1030853 [Leucogyrophana mollusca]|uniref:Uncharacterized protein n=1 Tax=Leucogyrophana mollusca TaxID=85980 RepID=A0ACB8BSK4_9AGAM|nr:hypothetical protein BV22DRAFT_1030853 [Leucogyrophana mollusca]
MMLFGKAIVTAIFAAVASAASVKTHCKYASGHDWTLQLYAGTDCNYGHPKLAHNTASGGSIRRGGYSDCYKLKYGLKDIRSLVLSAPKGYSVTFYDTDCAIEIGKGSALAVGYGPWIHSDYTQEFAQAFPHSKVHSYQVSHQ